VTAWQQLGAAAIAPNPFAEPAFVLPAARAWGVDDLALLVVRDGSAWHAALPVRGVRSWRGVPGRCLAGWRHAYCYLGTPLVAGSDPTRSLTEMVRVGIELGGCLALDWVDVDGPLAPHMTAALRAGGRPVTVEQFERAALYRRERADYLEQTLSRHHRSEYRRKRRRLESEVGPLSLRDESANPAAYGRFLALEQSGWKGAAGTAMGSRSGHGRFFLEMAEGFASSGRFQLLSLASERESVAMRCDLLAGDMSFNFKVAYNERFARFSPGIQLYVANLDRFHSSGLAWSDSCADRANATLNRLWSGRRRLRSMVATRSGVAGAADYAKWRAAAAALSFRRRRAARQPARSQRHAAR
jgi:hypothetical protein